MHITHLDGSRHRVRYFTTRCAQACRHRAMKSETAVQILQRLPPVWQTPARWPRSAPTSYRIKPPTKKFSTCVLNPFGVGKPGNNQANQMKNQPETASKTPRVANNRTGRHRFLLESIYLFRGLRPTVLSADLDTASTISRLSPPPHRLSIPRWIDIFIYFGGQAVAQPWCIELFKLSALSLTETDPLWRSD